MTVRATTAETRKRISLARIRLWPNRITSSGLQPGNEDVALYDTVVQSRKVSSGVDRRRTTAEVRHPIAR